MNQESISREYCNPALILTPSQTPRSYIETILYLHLRPNRQSNFRMKFRFRPPRQRDQGETVDRKAEKLPNSVCVYFVAVSQWNSAYPSRSQVTCVRNNVIRETNSRQLIFRIEVPMNRHDILPDTSSFRVAMLQYVAQRRNPLAICGGWTYIRVSLWKGKERTGNQFWETEDGIERRWSVLFIDGETQTWDNVQIMRN